MIQRKVYCLWLSKEPHKSLFIAKGHTLFSVGQDGCPPIRSSDGQITTWLKQNNCAILTNDYDDFQKHSAAEIVIFGLPGQGVYLSRSDIIVECIKNCISTFGANPVPPGLYVLSYYRWD
jgi:hypothetical protein